MASALTLFSNDQTWKAELSAFKTSLFVYKTIGTAVTVYHREETAGFLGIGRKIDWVERPADHIYISNTYEGLLPNLSPSAAARSNSGEHVSFLDERLWAVGVALTFTGPPVTGSPTPGGNASLEVRSVKGVITVQIAQETLRGEVDAQ